MADALQQSRANHAAAIEQVARLQKELEQARQKTADIERNLTTERQTANEVIRGQQEQLSQLRQLVDAKNTELATAGDRIAKLEAELNETRASFGELRQERDNLLRERDHMAALLKLNEGGRIQELVDQNMALAKELRLAKEKFEPLQADNDSTKDELTDALRDLAVAKARIISIQKENSAQQTRVADLEQRLHSRRSRTRRRRQLRGDRNAARDHPPPTQDPGTPPPGQGLAARRGQTTRRRKPTMGRGRRAARHRRSPTHPRGKQADCGSFSRRRVRLATRCHPERRAAALGQAESEVVSYERAATRAFAGGRLAAAEEVFQVMLDTHPGHVPTMLKLGSSASAATTSPAPPVPSATPWQ